MFLFGDHLHDTLGARLEGVAVDLAAPVILPHLSSALLMRIAGQWEPLEGDLLWLGTGEVGDHFLGILRCSGCCPWSLSGGLGDSLG